MLNLEDSSMYGRLPYRDQNRGPTASFGLEMCSN